MYHLFLFMQGKIKKINVSEFEIVWNDFDKQETYPKVYDSLKDHGYRPFSHRNGFIEGVKLNNKFMVTTGRHRAVALQQLGYKEGYCILLTGEQARKRIKQSITADSLEGTSYKILMELKLIGAYIDFPDEVVYEIIGRNIHEYVKNTKPN